MVRAFSLTRSLLREPLFHVVVLGVVLFGLHRWVAPPRASEEITVSAAVLDGMRQDFTRRTGRQPSASDEQGMVDRFVDDEVLVREALGMGLDRGDIIVRRRLIQKMEFLIENSEPVPAPSDAELEAYVTAHADRYASPPRVTFTHVFVGLQQHPSDGAPVAAALEAQLEGGADPAALGDPFLRGREFRLHSQAELANIFGATFATDVMRMPENAWTGPLRSTFGFHVVRITERRAGAAPELATIRDRVTYDWREERRDTANREARERLRRRYVVRVEGKAP